MTFLRVLAGLLAIGVSVQVYFWAVKIRAGRVPYAVLRWSASGFFLLEALSIGGVLALAQGSRDVFLDLVAPTMWVLGVAGVISSEHVRFHFRYTRMFRDTETIRGKLSEAVELVFLYTSLCREVSVVSAPHSHDMVLLKVGETVVGRFWLTDGMNTALFTKLGEHFLGRYDWPPQAHEVAGVTVRYFGNERWELNDGSVPAYGKKTPKKR